MRRVFLAVASIILACTMADAQDLRQIEEAYLKIVRKVRPSVVSVTTFKTVTQRQRENTVTHVSTTQFSGIVVTKEGHIATIAKGVKGASRILVNTLEGRQYVADFVGEDERSNIGIIKVKNADGWQVQPAEFGDSGKLEVGSITVIVGCPSGLNHSVVYGNVSGLQRTLVSSRTYYTGMIQLSNPVSHSDPGGLVANSEGKLVGMVSPAFMKTPSFRRVEELIEALNRKMAEMAEKLAKTKKDEGQRQPRTPPDRVKRGLIRNPLPPDLYDPALSQGINFAIPGNVVKEVCNRIIKGEKQAWLGVLVRALVPPEMAQLNLKNGLYVLQVVPKGPAEKGGLKSNDIIVKVAGVPVKEAERLRQAILNSGVGSELAVTVYRKKQELNLKFKLEERK